MKNNLKEQDLMRIFQTCNSHQLTGLNLFLSLLSLLNMIPGLERETIFITGIEC